jgi:hypothetical protein
VGALDVGRERVTVRALFCDAGAVHVPGVLGTDDVDLARQAIELSRARPSPHYGVLSPAGAPRVDSDLFRWVDVPAVAAVVHHRRIVELACEVLDARAAVFVEDQWFASAPGASSPSPWHQDAPYYRLDRPFVTVWLALDDASTDVSLRIVTGSHLGSIYAPVEFASEMATIGGSGSLPPVPDVDADPHREVMSWDVRAGDAIVLDSRTLHATGNGVVGASGFRRLSTRWAHPDTRYVDVGPQVARFWDVLEHGLAFGDRLSCTQFPLLEPR